MNTDLIDAIRDKKWLYADPAMADHATYSEADLAGLLEVGVPERTVEVLRAAPFRLVQAICRESPLIAPSSEGEHGLVFEDPPRLIETAHTWVGRRVIEKGYLLFGGSSAGGDPYCFDLTGGELQDPPVVLLATSGIGHPSWETLNPVSPVCRRASDLIRALELVRTL